MARWVRFVHKSRVGFGDLDGDVVHVYSGSLFYMPRPTGEQIPFPEVELITPTSRSKMIAMWNNSRSAIIEKRRETPTEPLFFIKPASSHHPSHKPIRYPHGESGRVVFEGEIGVVIGRRCQNVSEAHAGDHILGYTCINDVTAQDIVNRDHTFPQYVRAKGFDTFGIFGPAIATGLQPGELLVQTFLNDRECQHQPVDDLVFGPLELVARLSRQMTLYPGDVIACGTSPGVEPIQPGDVIEVRMPGVGSLVNKVA